MKRNILIISLCLIVILFGVASVIPVMAADPNNQGKNEVTFGGGVGEEGTRIPFATNVIGSKAGGLTDTDDDEIIIGPFDISPAVLITYEEIEKIVREKWLPGDECAIATWKIQNLTNEKKYIYQYSWTNSDQGYIPLRTEYSVSGDGARENPWSNKFFINGGGEISLTADIFLGYDAPVATNVTVHIIRPRTTTPPPTETEPLG